MKTLLCCIGRRENQYIREYVEWYKNLGFTNIVICDNNYDGEEHFEEAIGDYVKSGFVIIEDYRNRTECQHQAYTDCYKKYGKDYDWIAFFDCDEFLTLTRKKNIDEYLSSILFKKYNMIHINWMCYGDCDRIEAGEGTLIERFPTPVMPYDFKKTYDFPENNHVKSIVRGGLDNVEFNKVGWSHTPIGVDTCCNNKGIVCRASSAFAPYDFTEAYIKHFVTKSTEEYVNKIKRGFPDQIVNESKYEFLIDLYFKINKKTQEKVDKINSLLGTKYGTKDENVKLFMLCYDKEKYDFVDDKVMTPIQCGASNGKDVCKLKDNTGDNISQGNFFYVENTGTYWIWKNVQNAKYKGQTQYRRRLKGVDDTMDFDKIFSEYDVICAKPYNYPANHDAFIPSDTLRGGYAYSHCVDDLDCLGEIIKEVHPDYADDWKKYIVDGENLYYSNGFVLPAEKYDEYCNFLFDLLGRWLLKNGIQRYEDVIVHVARNLGRGGYIRYEREGKDPMKLTWPEILWQIHIGGFLSERIFTLWLQHNIPQEKRYEVEYIKMEEMYI